MNALSYLAIIIFSAFGCYAQRQNNNWIFGYGARVNFSGANPVSSTASVSSNEATASVSDPATGQLLFYTDARNVWNANNQIMPNGANLLGGYFNSSTQGALIVPFPDDNQRYYIFTLDELEVQPGNPVVDDGLRYSVVDMTLNGGLGDVQTSNMNTQLETGLTEKLIVIRSINIQGFWVIAHRRNANEFLAWKIDACGIDPQPVVSAVGSNFSPITSIGANEGWAGAMDASSDGTRIGMPVDYSTRLEFFDFNKTTGVVSNPLTVNVTDDATPPFLRKYGACFSPDGSKFYYTNTNSVYQLDLSNYTSAAIASSHTLIYSTLFQPVGYPCFQIEKAPNNKLYVAIGNSPTLDEISNPNALGLSCGYIPGAVNLAPGVCQLGLPDQVPLGGFAACNSNPCSYQLNATVVQPTCGNANGSISFAPSPSDTYFYNWPFPSNMIVSSVSGLAPGVYDVTITNAAGCSIDTSITLTNIPCGNFCNPNGNLFVFSNYDGGILTINVDQNIPNLKIGICTYEPIRVSFIGPFVGNITQVVYAGMNSNQNNNNCGQGNFTTSIQGVPSSIVSISPPMNPPPVGYTPVHGNGSGPWGGLMYGTSGVCDTTINAGGSNTPDEIVYFFQNATGGTLLTHQTQYNCWTSDTLNVTAGGNCCILPPGSNVCPTLTISSTNVVPVLCTGQSNGSFTISTSGGATPYDYVITGIGGANFGTFNNVSGNQVVNNLPAGTYTVSVTDNNNCTGSGTVVVTTQSTIPTTPTITTSPATCSVAGTANISNYNGSLTYIFTPTGPSVGGGGSISGMTTNTNYTVLSSNGSCTSAASNTFSISPQQNTLIVSATSTATTCGNNNGSATVSINGGTGPFNISWNTTPVQTSQTATNLASGTYTVTVTDFNNCSASATVSVASSSGVSASATGINATCGTNNGAASAIANGGNGIFSYSWNTNPIQTTQAISGLGAGTYIVTVTSNGCSDTGTVVINTGGNLQVVLTPTTANICNGTSATITASGATTYSWSPANGLNTTSGTNVTASPTSTITYTVTGTSGNCSDTAMITVNVNTVNASIISKTDVACFGNSTGSASAIANGGNGVYSYNWSPSGGNGSTASNLAAGTYTVTITSGACSDTAIVVINQPSLALSLSAVSTVAACGSNNGTATATITGGTGPYILTWNTSPTQSSLTANNLAAGTYTASVTDSKGCTASTQINVGSSTNLSVSISGSNIICSGSNTVLTAIAPGATSYTWNTSPTQSTPTINVSPIGTTTYTVNANNGASCSGTASITVSVVNNPNVTLSGDNLICLGESTTLTASGSGNFVWLPDGSINNSITVSPLTTTTYTVNITNGNPLGCNSGSSTITVQVGGLLGGVNAGSDQTITIGQSATLTATGSTSQYFWSTNQFGSSIVVSPIETTTYTVYSNDNLGCRVYDTVVVNVEIKCGDVFVPSGFSPNSDGSNDLECVYGNCIKTIYWAIYDRWGQKVFETSDKSACWDGFYRGQLMNSNVFVYKLEAQLIDGKQVTKKGSITLTR